MHFRLEERISRKDYKPTPSEQKRIDRREIYPYQLPRHEFIPTGKLTLRIGGWSGGRSTWADAKIQRVENCLNDFLASLFCKAVEQRIEREEQERKEQKQREERARQEEVARLRSEEQVKLDALRADACNWQEAQSIRSYLAVVRDVATKRAPMICFDSELEVWLIWAEQQADRLDPLIESPSSILDNQEV